MMHLLAFVFAITAIGSSVYADHVGNPPCLHEDDILTQQAQGNLDGSTTVTLRFCGEVDYPGGNPGGLGFRAAFAGRGDLRLTIHRPDGHETAGLDQCVLPPVAGASTIEPGTYVVTFSAIRGRKLYGIVDVRPSPVLSGCTP